MAEQPVRADAFAGFPAPVAPPPGEPGLVIAAVRDRALVTLGGPVENELFRAAARVAIGADLPRTPGHVTAGNGRQVLCLGPEEWLVAAPGTDGWELERALVQALGVRGGKAVDVGHGRAVFRVTGPRTRDLLAKFCPIDLRAAALPPGRCTQTLFGKVGVLLHALGDGRGIDLAVSRSYGDAVAQALCEGAREYGYAIGEAVVG